MTPFKRIAIILAAGAVLILGGVIDRVHETRALHAVVARLQPAPPAARTIIKVILLTVNQKGKAFLFIANDGTDTAISYDECLHSKVCTAELMKLAAANHGQLEVIDITDGVAV